MKLINARVLKFRNYVDSDKLEVDDSITSLIGKNESGKTAFLVALHSLKPHNPNEVKIDVITDYPRWFKVRDQRETNLDDFSFIEAYFSLDEDDINNLSRILGIDIPNETELSIERTYNGNSNVGLCSDEEKWIKSLLESDIIKDELKTIVSDSNNLSDIIQKLEPIKQERVKELEKLNEENTQKSEEISALESQKENKIQELNMDADDSEEISPKAENPEINKIDNAIDKINGKITNNNEKINQTKENIEELSNAIETAEKIQHINEYYIPDEYINEVIESLPTFFYFGSYNTLKGRIDLDELINKEETERDTEDQTALALLKMVGVEGEELTDPQYELRKAELESAASEMTRKVLEYWTQNEDLLVELDTDSDIVNTQTGKDVVHRYLDVRLRDERHQMSTNFSTRSTGFQWFVSFLVAFSDFTDQDNVIILLDEPGLGLHGSAQGDLLNFIEKELGNGRQVIYTNHSPFMVNPKRLERVRLVEDNTSRDDPDLGAKILDEVLNVKMPETLFPLQAALGYDIAQNLFVGQYTLLVEGPSDYIYLELLSEYLEEKSMTSIDDKIIITPVGGADKIPTFVALLGTHLDVTVLVDANMKNNQKIQDLINLNILKENRLISIGQVTENNESANIEDLFSDEEYLSLYNEAFKTNIKPEDIPGEESIVTRLEKKIGHSYNHYAPLKVLQRNLDRLDELSEETLKRVEKLFDTINETYSIL